ncbi:MAG: tRNA lysidine(34) synthetase TilS [Candidatus Kryptonium sp.]|nr:tRNA lysidine(34) synthetase TilS [Candidatus Kryptonium sp.]
MTERFFYINRISDTAEMIRDFINRFREFIQKNKLISPKDKIIVAVSGGVDSIVLLDLLNELKNQLKLELIVAHFNHKLRGEESDEDENFVKAFASQLGLECYVRSEDTREYCKTKKISIQEGARELRYNFFETLRLLKGFDKIAIAHNANDNAETVLLNLFRGSGVSGLAGIQVKRGNIIRPLLFATRDEIETYASEKGLPYRIDSSNFKTAYRRNYIRLKLLPLISENINPAIIETLNRTAQIFSELSEFVRYEVSKIINFITIEENPGKVLIDIHRLKSYLFFIQESVIISAIETFFNERIDFAKVLAVLNLIDSTPGSSIAISKNLYVYRDRQYLVFLRKPEFAETEIYTYVHPGEKFETNFFIFSSEFVKKEEVQFNRDSQIEYIDADLIADELILRNWQPGDWFVPLGMKGRKKISDFLIDLKIPVYDKKKILVLESEGKIVWVCGLRLDDRFKITDSTQKILKIEFHPKPILQSNER